jgi:hypothetical protein
MKTIKDSKQEIVAVTHDIFATALFACCKPTPNRIAKDKKAKVKKTKTE